MNSVIDRHRWRVGLLGALDYPMMGYIIRAFLKRNISVDAVIIDAKGFGPKAQEIHDQRTRGKLPRIAIEEFEQAMFPFFVVSNHSSETCASLVRSLDLDILVNAGTPRILKKVILDAPRAGILSCHPGMIPRFRGCTNVEWAIFHDEPVANTVFYMSTEIDRGPIILQEKVFFSKNDDYETIRVHTQVVGFDLLARGVEKVLQQRLVPAMLPHPGEGQYFPVIGADEMNAVREKTSRGAYRYQM